MPDLDGDCLSMKWVCERERRDAWPGIVRDNFGKSKTPQTWEEHVEQGDEARAENESIITNFLRLRMKSLPTKRSIKASMQVNRL
jgi:hypothetical protein